jgi:hypothetical protein
MSNAQLTAMTFLILAAHIAALGAAVVFKRGPGAALGLNLVLAAVTVIWLALHPKWLNAPIDWQVAGLVAFEALVAGAAVLALRGVGPAVGVSWTAFGLHLLASVGAVVFVLTFKIDRLI